MFNRSQTSTEYLVILAVVIVIALIVVGVLGGIPSIGSGLSESVAKASLRSAKVAIVNYAVTDMNVKLNVRNNNYDVILVNQISIRGVPCYSVPPFTLSAGATKSVTCNDVHEYGSSSSQLAVVIDWTDLSNDATYIQEDSNLALVGSVSAQYLKYVQSKSAWGTEVTNGCYNSTADPVPICTCADLNEMRNNASLNFKLQNNIDFVRCKEIFEEDFLTSPGWNPIGSCTGVCHDSAGEDPFTGNLNGAGYVISNLFSDMSSTHPVGLIGLAYTASFSNLGLVNVDVTGDYYVGGLIGFGGIVQITNSYVEGVADGDANIGTLVGFLNTADMDKLFGVGDVTANRYSGGLIGGMYASNLSNSYFNGTVIASGNGMGGLIGFTNYNSKISNSYYRGDITGDEQVGGLIGFAYSTNVTKCQSSGSVTGADYTGGLFGDSDFVQISDSHTTSLVTCTGSGYCGGITGDYSSVGGPSNFVSESTWVNYSAGSPETCEGDAGSTSAGTNPVNCVTS